MISLFPQIRKHINVMEKRDYKRGSHLDNLIRKGLAKNDVFYKISTEMAEFERQTTIKNARMPVSVESVASIL